METVAFIMATLVIGGVMFAVDKQRREGIDRARRRTQTTSPLPAPGPYPPAPTPPSPTPAPGPEPTPPPEHDYISIPEETWRTDGCWWSADEPGDVVLDLGKEYFTTWPSDWQGDEPVNVYFDPPDLADVESSVVWEGNELYVEVVIVPKRRGWGYLMATEGTPGEAAVKGQVPWRAECMRVEVF